MVFVLFFMGIALLMVAASLINHNTTDGDLFGSILFIIGFLVLAFLTFHHYPAIKECEKELTRQEQCVLIAVPESYIEEK